MRTGMLVIFLLSVFVGHAQKRISFLVVDRVSTLPLINASISINKEKKGVISDSLGQATIPLINPTNVRISHTGYEAKVLEIIPGERDTLIYVSLIAITEEIEEVIVTSTRSRRNIADIPTRVEVVAGEELAEKAVMQPGNVRMLLTESTGIQTQQTSATSGSASIRIQGLEGRYTQLLRDGFPLYSGFSSGLSILQIPPLDLKRVELIKGSASTLYGGGAIAGLVNFISKEPGGEPEHSGMFNINQTGAIDASMFNSQRNNKWGHTVYASYNGQKVYDNNDDGLSDIPQYRRVSINPKLFYYGKKTKAQFGITTNLEKREGGDLAVLKGRADAVHQFFEKNNSSRFATLINVATEMGKNSLTLKNSISYFTRQLQQPGYLFEGRQWSTFTEINLYMPRKISEWVTGLNIYSDDFRQTNSLNPLREQRFITGLFVQNNLKLSENLSVEAGLRTDYAKDYDVFVLPRLSLMYRLSNKFTTRLGGGLGYKLPTVFTEQSEENVFKNLSAINKGVKSETSTGINWDLNYRTTIGEDVRLSINQLFFFTKLKKPIINDKVLTNNYFSFDNANGNLYSNGFETNFRVQVEPVSFNLGYTYIHARFDTSNLISKVFLTAKHRIYFNAMYEVEGKFRLAYELFYTGSQFTGPSEKKKGFWVTGISAERRWEHFSLFINAENFTDTRQSKSESMYTGSITQPQFRPIWGNTEGFILNGGFRVFL